MARYLGTCYVDFPYLLSAHVDFIFCFFFWDGVSYLFGNQSLMGGEIEIYVLYVKCFLI